MKTKPTNAPRWLQSLPCFSSDKIKSAVLSLACETFDHQL